MYRHPSFELLLHDDEELAGYLGSPISQRITIHEWPLSCVQRIVTEQGDRHIYKVQAPPTLEAQFYARAQSLLLVSVRVIEAKDNMTAMLMEEIQAPRLKDIPLKESEAAATANDLMTMISRIDGDLPVMIDISTEEGWTAYIEAALRDISECIHEGSFKEVDFTKVNKLRKWSEAPALLAEICSPSGLVHADLKAENVLATNDGYRVLDWQRPIWGPVSLDAATLLLSLGVDAARYVPIGIIQMYHFLHLAWYAQAARKWVPQGKPWFDRLISEIAHDLELKQL
ncbi:aminoglycoside/choline kinase family phosphotransferase [Paenibacillus rhizosphaerae]|uniref:Aminoglycoside/choline kinase family phosphotransferase n=1 Tax=Paenibacillus rhizosphaerae TaxID=297318 RepID=A0A839TJ93_9BACL|nr:phosphotransferase [Paenibacillus rhizosphaerae]MBB3126876.1 aminoglycoside/choline kinase family phosphotransferase [Paenibacillus rhizosphaerae]